MCWKRTFTVDIICHKLRKDSRKFVQEQEKLAVFEENRFIPS